MLTFYIMDTNLFQVRLGDMDIYFSFKMPIAYRSKHHGLRMRGCYKDYLYNSTIQRHIEIITVCNSKEAVFMDKEVFDWEYKDQFKRTIYDLGKQCTLERMGINAGKQRNPGKSGNMSTGDVKKG